MERKVHTLIFPTLSLVLLGSGGGFITSSMQSDSPVAK